MTHTELIRQIRDYIKELTGRDFINPIIVRDILPQGHAVGLEVRQYQPIWYSADLPDDEFLGFVRKELRQAKWLKVDFRKAVRNTALDHPLNAFRSPYDTTRINGED